MVTANSANGGAVSGILSVQIVGARVESRAMENLLQAQPGFTVVDETASAASLMPQVILILGRDGLAVLQRRRLRSVKQRRQERFALLSNGQDIDFRLVRELPIRVFIGADEPIPVFLQGLREAAMGASFCSPQMVPILVSATSQGTNATAAASKTASNGAERPRSVARTNRPTPAPPTRRITEFVEGAPANAPVASAAPSPGNTGNSGSRGLSEEMRRALRLGLSDREAEIALQAGQGLSNQQIANALNITLSTVKFHLYRVYQKLGIERRSQLTLLTSDSRELTSVL